MKFAISLGGWFVPSAKMAAVAKRIEKTGFDYLYCADSQMIYRDPFPSLALIARETSRIKIGTCVSPIITREPSVLANSMVTIEEMAPGRTILGVGSGDSGVRRIGQKPASPKEMEEKVLLIRKMMSGERIGFEGGDFNMRFAKYKIPIYIAATGPKMLRLAGKIADGVMVMVGAAPELHKWAIEQVIQGAKEAGRDPKEVDLVCMLLGPYIGETSQAALDFARPQALWFYRNTPVLVKVAGGKTPTESVRKMDYETHDYVHDDKYAGQYKSPDFITPEMGKKFMMCGTADEIVKAFKGIERMGFNQVIVRHTEVEYGWEKFLDLLIEDIMPSFR